MILGFIVLLGTFLRTYHLSSDPAGFFCDEASIGWNAYTILTSGADQYGTAFPVFFKAFGDYKGPIEIYSSVPAVALFGLNVFAVRLTSALYGILTIIILYFLTQELLGKNKEKTSVALLSALALAISPWAIQFSRVAFEMMPLCFYTCLGLYLFLKAQHKPLLLPFSIIAFAFSFYSYSTARLFIPPFCVGLTFFFATFFLKHKKETIISAIILIILLIPFFQGLSAGTARWDQVNIFATPPQGETVAQHILTNYVRHFFAGLPVSQRRYRHAGRICHQTFSERFGRVVRVSTAAYSVWFVFSSEEKSSSVFHSCSLARSLSSGQYVHYR